MARNHYICIAYNTQIKFKIGRHLKVYIYIDICGYKCRYKWDIWVWSQAIWRHMFTISFNRIGRDKIISTGYGWLVLAIKTNNMKILQKTLPVHARNIFLLSLNPLQEAIKCVLLTLHRYYEFIDDSLS